MRNNNDVLDANGYHTSCHDCANATVTASATGGVEPFQFHWRHTDYNTATISNAGEPYYDLVVSDANGCKAIDKARLSIPERDDWSVNGNSGLNADSTLKWLGTTDSTDLMMKANGQPMLRLGADGNVDVLGKLRVQSAAAPVGTVARVGINEWGEVAPLSPCLLLTENGLEPQVLNPDWVSATNKIYVDYDCPVNVGIGTDNPTHRLHVNGMTFFNGHIGVGTTPSNAFMLDVNGNIRAQGIELTSSAVLGRTVINTADSSNFELTGLVVKGIAEGRILECLGNSNYPALTVSQIGVVNIGNSNDNTSGTLNVLVLENAHGLVIKSVTATGDAAVTELQHPTQRAYALRRSVNGSPVEQYALFGNGDVLQHGTLMMGLENGQWPSTGAGRIIVNTPQGQTEQHGIWVNTNHSGWLGGIRSNVQGNEPHTRALSVSHNGEVSWEVHADGTTHICAEVHAKKIKIESGWCDFVFNKDYPLPSLYDTERRISELGHLPGLPSQKEVEDHGLDVSEAMRGQMLHMEEMYLHMIEMRKEFDALKRENAELKALITKQ